jgi:hypothetical protein
MQKQEDITIAKLNQLKRKIEGTIEKETQSKGKK